jgi:hypothetical protein
MNTPAPLRPSATPSASSSRHARAAVLGFTSAAAARPRTEGRQSPAPNRPAATASSAASTSCRDGGTSEAGSMLQSMPPPYRAGTVGRLSARPGIAPRAPRRAAAGALLAALAACGRPAPPEEAPLLEARLAERVRGWVAEGDLARADGYVYAVEVGELLAWAALAGDRGFYDALHAEALRFVRDDPSDPYTRGFVAWRRREGEPHDASGTTEALRIAEGLWHGAAAFDLPADRALALVILRGYARHAAELHGVWLVRNYFNLGTRAFATNSFLVDYAPDFLAEVAKAEGDAELADVARRSAALLGAARAPSGLLCDAVQPELATLTEPELAIFSPNDVIQLANAGTAALMGARSRPEAAVGVLGFALERLPRLDAAYYGRTGEVALRRRPGAETWGILLRLALALEDGAAFRRLWPRLAETVESFLEEPSEPRLYTAAELLLALRAAAPAR